MGIISLLLIWFDQKETLNKNETSKAKLSDDYKELFLNEILVLCYRYGLFSWVPTLAFLTGAPVISAEYFELAPSVQGYLFAILGLGFLLGNFLTGRFAMKIGLNRLMLWGCFIALTRSIIAELYLFKFFIFGPLSFAPMFLLGLGQGLIVPNAAAGIVSVNPKLAGSASGLGATIQVMMGGILAYITGLYNFYICNASTFDIYYISTILVTLLFL